MARSRTPDRLYLLSPASCSGRRVEILLSERARFDLAVRLRERGATLGEAFSFLSGLYFRAKLAYSDHFGRRRRNVPASFVITPGRGLVAPDTVVTAADLRAFGEVSIDIREPLYRDPLERDARRLAQELKDSVQVVLLGSIATAKYRDVLVEAFGRRLHFPRDFIGRGEMSRGGLMLRAIDANREMEYARFVPGTKYRGVRPPKLAPRKVKST